MSRTGDNIYKRKDGRWEGRFITGTKPDGKSKYSSVYGKSYEEVKSKMPVFCDDIYGTKTTVEEISHEWLESVKGTLKESTIANYRMKLRKHINSYFKDVEICRVTTEKVYAFINCKLESGLSAKYVSDIVIVLKSVFKYAVSKYNIFDPIKSVHLPSKSLRKKEPQLLSLKQQKKFIKFLDTNHNINTLGVSLSFFLGLRIGELCGLKWGDIDLENKLISINKTVQRIATSGKGSKTKLIITEPKSRTSMREIPLPDVMIKLLKSFRRSDNVYVLSASDKPVEPRTMQNRFKTMLKEAKLPRINFHSLRHMFATNCISTGCDVKTLSELLGHSSVEVTLNRYVHSSLERKRELIEKMHSAA